MPKVSVILPVYNVEEYLQQALDSIINQTLEDIEIICVNDGSKDNSLSILEEYASKDNRIKIINQENQGQGASRNNAIKISSGKYIAFVDPDDWIELDMFEKLYNKAEKYNTDLIEFSYFRNHERNNSVRKKKINLALPTNKIIKPLDYPKYIFQPPRYAWNKFFQTKLLKDNNILFGQGRWHEDHNFVIAARALAERVLNCPDEYFYNYRVRLNSSNNILNLDVIKKVQLLKELKAFLSDKNIFKDLEYYFNRYALNGLIDAYKRVPDDYKKEFDSNVEKFLNKKHYIAYEKNKNKNENFLQTIFSVKKRVVSGKQYKVVTILGITFTLYKIC